MQPARPSIGILDPADPRWARHADVTLPIETTTLDTAARELDPAVAGAELYRSEGRGVPQRPAVRQPGGGMGRAHPGAPTLLAPPQ